MSELPDSLPEVQTIIELLQRPSRPLSVYYKVGKHLHHLKDTQKRASVTNLTELAALINYSPSTLTKACFFFRSHTATQVRELEQLGVTWSQASTALAVHDSARRLELLRLAVVEGWRGKDIAKQIQLERGSVRGGGRHRRAQQKKGLIVDLAELTNVTRRWLHFWEEVWQDGFKEYKADIAVVAPERREDVMELLARANSALGVLAEGCRKVQAQMDELKQVAQKKKRR
jgi:hypothetical protein